MEGREGETESDRTRARDTNRDRDRGMMMHESLDPGSSEVSYSPVSLSYNGMHVLPLSCLTSFHFISFIHLTILIECLLMPGIILGSGNRDKEKRDSDPALGFTFLIGLCFCHLQLKQCCLPDHARFYMLG